MIAQSAQLKLRLAFELEVRYLTSTATPHTRESKYLDARDGGRNRVARPAGATIIDESQ